jgi:HK97 family phage prohead protease
MSVQTVEPTLEQTCAHEAGHASMALLLGVPVRLVDVTGDETALGRTHHGLAENTDEDHVTRMKIILGGLIESADSFADLPVWPLDLDHGTTDRRRLAALAKLLSLDSAGYDGIVNGAIDLWGSARYKRLHAVISLALEQHGRLDSIALQRIKALTEGETVQHAIKAATVEATDRGEFTAIAAAYTVDRVNDQIVRGAFANTIERWRASGKRVPLHWNHQGEAANVIGWIDPATMRETAEGLSVSGKLDIDSSDTAREAWRSMRNGTMSLSFGYVTLRRRERQDGINELHELDLFEISIVPHPANPDTRIVEMKSLDVVDLAEQYKLDAIREEARQLMLKCMAGTDDGVDHLRVKSERIAREFAPITVTEFQC